MEPGISRHFDPDENCACFFQAECISFPFTLVAAFQTGGSGILSVKMSMKQLPECNRRLSCIRGQLDLISERSHMMSESFRCRVPGKP